MLKIILILSIVFLYSCKCEPSLKLGEFNLTVASMQFVPYTGNEILVFEDNDGFEHKLKSKVGRELKDLVMRVRTICDDGTFDKQFQYYEIQRYQIAYFDSLDKQIFYTDLTTHFEDADDLDSIAIYDFLRVSSVIDGSPNGEIEILTDERQNHLSVFYRNEMLRESDFLGDTIIYGKEFKDVFKSTTSQGKSIFYSKEKGVVAFKMTEEKYWVLKY